MALIELLGTAHRKCSPVRLSRYRVTATNVLIIGPPGVGKAHRSVV
ncbi:hypothetical protein ACFYVR_26485 [Rhodococcus sp. NPDC003318]